MSTYLIHISYGQIKKPSAQTSKYILLLHQQADCQTLRCHDRLPQSEPTYGQTRFYDEREHMGERYDKMYVQDDMVELM